MPLRFAIIGCGNIAKSYADDLVKYDAVELAGFTDLDAERAAQLCSQVGRGKAYPSLDALLADASIDGIVNLTIHHAHYETTKRALEAGKHVFSEKPLAMTAREAQDLVALADRRGLRLGGAPMTFLGDAQQTALKLLREGRIGTVRMAYAEMNHGRIETWHPNPAPFYDVGPVFDVAVYPLMVLTAAIGPVSRVTAVGRSLQPQRTTKDGQPFRIGNPDWVTAVLDFHGGAAARLTASFYVHGSLSKQQGIEFHGDDATLQLDSPSGFDAEVRVGSGGKLEPVPLVGEGDKGIRWGRGVVDLAEAIRDGRPHRSTGKHAAHIVDVVESIHRSAADGSRAVDVSSRFDPPAPMPWAQ